MKETTINNLKSEILDEAKALRARVVALELALEDKNNARDAYNAKLEAKIQELEAKSVELEKPRNMAPGAQAGRLASKLGEGFFVKGYRDDGGRLKFWFKRTPKNHELAGKHLYGADVKAWMSAHSL